MNRGALEEMSTYARPVIYFKSIANREEHPKNEITSKKPELRLQLRLKLRLGSWHSLDHSNQK